jgi:hypothetical protein
LADAIKTIKESHLTLAESFLKLQQRVYNQESEVGDMKVDFQTVDSAVKKLENEIEIGTIKEADPTGKLISTWAQVDPNDII